jgi:hypothetical protein
MSLKLANGNKIPIALHEPAAVSFTS